VSVRVGLLYLLFAVDFGVFCTHLTVVGGATPLWMFPCSGAFSDCAAGVSQPYVVLNFEAQFQHAFEERAPGLH
jgi:hypothetical protein